jgi:hypothetical protein
LVSCNLVFKPTARCWVAIANANQQHRLVYRSSGGTINPPDGAFLLKYNIQSNLAIELDNTSVMNIQAEKAMIIEQFRQVNDINLIYAIKNMLDYALKKEQENIEVPETHQKLVMERFDKVRKDPDRLLDWDEAKKTLKA